MNAENTTAHQIHHRYHVDMLRFAARFEAVTLCHETHTAGTLTHISSEAKQTFLTDNVFNTQFSLPGAGFWIGLRKNKWTWFNGK